MILSWLGILIGVGAILLGNVLEGGHIEQLVQPTAAMIVFGGTIGAVLLSSSTPDFVRALQGLPRVFFRGLPDHSALITELSQLASLARREGLVAMDKALGSIRNPFLQNHLRHVIDGYDPAVLAEMMEEEIEHHEEEALAAAKVWETAGGFSPTIGILGAVLGLIHVMANLSDSSKLGAGIAVAFVATVYGVGGANLILLPIANKLKKFALMESVEKKLIYTGLMGIQNGLNPRIIEERLRAVTGHGAHAGGGAEGAPQGAQQRAA
ncbi:MAG: flagellar motor protein [Bdellovibrionales bacterium]|nr:flagellar motor protein [Bdellovibrionales bacterium]